MLMCLHDAGHTQQYLVLLTLKPLKMQSRSTTLHTMKYLDKWISIALVNLSIVALLGFSIRSKILFPISFIDYKFTLNAHSHFAFGGWVTLALMALMRFQILPEEKSKKKIYAWLMWLVQLNAVGMLISFLVEGYAFFSILFSTLFIFVTYGFAYVFIKDVLTTSLSKSVKILSTSALLYMVISSVGPYILAYLMATHSQNLFLFKDAIYTYLHLQYNGFFTLAVFALLFQRLNTRHTKGIWFARILSFSVIPTLFISYLWHYPGLGFMSIAVIGSLSLLVCVVLFFIWFRDALPAINTIHPKTKRTMYIGIGAFALKTIFQSLTIIPSLGHLVFANRPVIIGFLHLVLLAFITLCILVIFIDAGLLKLTTLVQIGLLVFIFGVMLNEVVLFTQGLGFMLMLSSTIASWLLWGAAICLLLGATLMAIGKIFHSEAVNLNFSRDDAHQSFSQS